MYEPTFACLIIIRGLFRLSSSDLTARNVRREPHLTGDNNNNLMTRYRYVSCQVRCQSTTVRCI